MSNDQFKNLERYLRFLLFENYAQMSYKKRLMCGN